MDELELMREEGPVEPFDRETFGMLLRSLRKRAGGYDSVAHLIHDLKKHGFDISADTIYAVEQGRQPMLLEHYLAIMSLCNPRDGHAWFASAYREDLREWILNS